MTLDDRFGRTARKLRVSVTDRCNFRCAYCMPLKPVWLPRTEILSFEEIERVVRVAVTCGVRKVRLTGGEPLVRRGLPDLVRRLSALAPPDSPDLTSPSLSVKSALSAKSSVSAKSFLSLTTNGYFLDEQAAPLAAAGLQSANISLDTLDRRRFRDLARFDGLERTLKGIEAARRAGMRVKLNAVVVRGQNEEEIPALCRYGRERGMPVRFIEFMPLDGDRAWSREAMVPESEILDRASAVAPLAPVEDDDRASPARRWRFADGIGEVGVIASVTRPFCRTCDRIRLTADGKFRTCLFALEETDLRGPLRSGASDVELAGLLAGAVRDKGEGHAIHSVEFTPPARAMNAIGG